MKKFTYLVIATAALSMVACTGGNKAGYTITGTVEGASDGDTVYLQEANGRNLTKLDTAVITKGTFTFEGTQDSVVSRYVTCEVNGEPLMIDFFLENGKINVALTKDNDAVTGTPNNDAYQEIRAQINDISKKMNAIYEAMEDIHWFRTYRFERISELLGPVKMSVTGIEAGTLHNMVPATCHFIVDIRVNELYTNQEIFDTIRDHVKCDMIPRSFSLNSSSVSLSHPMVKRCIELGLSPYGSPTTSNQAVIPCPSLKIGPGDSARSHTANEYIRLEEIREGIELFKSIIQYVE